MVLSFFTMFHSFIYIYVLDLRFLQINCFMKNKFRIKMTKQKKKNIEAKGIKLVNG